MVVFLIILTLIVFLAIDFFVRREDRTIQEAQEGKKSPIFLSPEKALKTLPQTDERLFHLSHSWIQQYDRDYYYVGFDSLIPTLFSTDIKITNLPKVGSYQLQGNTIWNIHLGNHSISQLAPISGNVVEVNPVCRMDISIPASQVEKSWILKIKADSHKNEVHNLLNNDQIKLMNTALKDELMITAQQANYFNDGGKIDPTFIKNLSETDWKNIINKFFPYMET